MPKLRFGILCDSYQLPAWAADCIRQVGASGLAEMVVVLRSDGPRARSARPLLLRLYEELWLERRSRALRLVDLESELRSVEQLVLSSGSVLRASGDDAVRKLRRYELDFILTFSADTPRAEVLEVPRWGVWAYRHVTDLAPYFWEVLEGETRTEVVLDRLSREGNDAVLHRGFFGTSRVSWVDNADQALLGSADFCARVCAELVAHGDDAFGHAAARESRARRERAPGNRETALFMLRAERRLVQKLWELAFYVEVWNVGFSSQSVQQIVRDGRVRGDAIRWCKPHHPGDFIADPFAYEENGRMQVLVEEYVGGKGRICRLAVLHPEDRLELAVDMEPPYHLSYPCIFREDGEVYCVPEAFQSGKASLYRRVNGGWQLVRTLIEGQPVVDPTLFKHQGLYWLLYTRQDDGAWGSLKLYGAYAERLDAEWKPHALNPLKCDIGSSRPAGSPLLMEGQLYRPSQDCSETYGGAVVMNRIVKLSPTEFEELVAARVAPAKDGPYPAGLHTINPMGEASVIDGKRFCFDWLAWRKNAYVLRQLLK